MDFEKRPVKTEDAVFLNQIRRMDGVQGKHTGNHKRKASCTNPSVFEIEGRKKYAVIRNGEYADEYIMARYKI